MNKKANNSENPIGSGTNSCPLPEHMNTPTTNVFHQELMTEAELIEFLRIPEISGSANLHNVIEHLKRYRNLPRIHICNKALYPKKAVLDWIEKETLN